MNGQELLANMPVASVQARSRATTAQTTIPLKTEGAPEWE